jgi:lipoate-protein ligase A
VGGHPRFHAYAVGHGSGGETGQVRSLITTPVAKTVNEDLLERYLDEPTPLFRIYEPQTACIVMGAGGRTEQDVFLQRARTDGVPLLRRRGGGGTVVLSRGQVVLALVTEVALPFHNLQYFRAINNWFRICLADLGVCGIEDRGISDLAIADRKILGTSLYRRRKILFYQGSLLVSNDLSLFDRYLRFPVKVPEYRRERGHLDFCTNLTLAGYPVDVTEVITRLEKVVEEQLPLLD